MIRALLMIAAAGFVLSVASFAAALAIGGPEALARGAWGAAPWIVSKNWDSSEEHGRWGGAGGPTVTRELTWSGADTVEFDVRADVTYTQAPGPAKLTVTGPQGLVERLAIDDGRIYFRGRSSYSRINIVMTAPNVTRFELNGNDRLTIENYDQDRLRLDLSGSPDVTARGRTRELSVEISGSGQADLGQLAAEAATVDISGSGEATIAPRESASVDISGSGEVTLLTNPKSLSTDISGSGSIRQGSRTPSPTPSESPSPSRTKTL
jgi:hypothetical protein